jgi:hypothetical protein
MIAKSVRSVWSQGEARFQLESLEQHTTRTARVRLQSRDGNVLRKKRGNRPPYLAETHNGWRYFEPERRLDGFGLFGQRTVQTSGERSESTG